MEEIYKKINQLKLNYENHEKAYKMAKMNGETQLAQAARANFERLAAKLK